MYYCGRRVDSGNYSSNVASNNFTSSYIHATLSIKGWSLDGLPLNLSWACFCFDRYSMKEMTFQEFWAQALKNSGNLCFFSLGSQLSCNDKAQSPGEAHMEEIQVLAPPPHSHSFMAPLPTTARARSPPVRDPSWDRPSTWSCTSWHHMEQRHAPFSEHCWDCKYTCKQINGYYFQPLGFGVVTSVAICNENTGEENNVSKALKTRKHSGEQV